MSTAGTLFTISAPSGAGKTTLVKKIKATQQGVVVSTSHTTRQKRKHEVDGVDYYFITEKKFLSMVEKGEFLEHAAVFRNFYGTSQQEVDTLLKRGQDVILEIDWQGMQQVKKQRPTSIAISIVPPSLDVLKQRLISRAADSTDEIEHRMSQAKREIEHYAECDYLVVNDSLDKALVELKSIIVATRCSVDKQTARYRSLLQQLLA